MRGLFKRIFITCGKAYNKFRDTHGEVSVSQMFGRYPDVVTIEQMAEMLNIGRTMAYSLITENQIRCVRIGNRIRIPKKYIVEYLDRSLT